MEEKTTFSHLVSEQLAWICFISSEHYQPLSIKWLPLQDICESRDSNHASQ